jgi:hypothetical protein
LYQRSIIHDYLLCCMVGPRLNDYSYSYIAVAALF